MLDKYKIHSLINISIKLFLPAILVLAGLGFSIGNLSNYSPSMVDYYAQLSKKISLTDQSNLPINQVFAIFDSEATISNANLTYSIEKFWTSNINFLNHTESTSSHLFLDIVRISVIDLAFFWRILLILLTLGIFIYTMATSKNTKEILKSLQKIILKIVMYTTGHIFIQFISIYLGYVVLNKYNIFTPLYSNSELANYTIQPILYLILSLYGPVGLILLFFCFINLLIFLTQYFGIFANNEVQNVLINRSILKRSYNSKPKNIRQKIMQIAKVQKFNSEYNSNFNNFTRFSTNLPTNKDFAFDYLGIEESKNKSNLATIIDFHERDIP
jgi:hypothetical protein